MNVPFAQSLRRKNNILIGIKHCLIYALKVDVPVYKVRNQFLREMKI